MYKIANMTSPYINEDIMIRIVSDEIITDIQQFNHSILQYETFISNSHNLSPNRLKAELSPSMYSFARKQICEFFRNIKPNAATIYGLTSGNMRYHILYLADDGIVYAFHFEHGKIKLAYYFTNAEMKEFFEDADDGLKMPKYEDPQIVRDSLDY
jgi:hypothetical protein